jgi:HAE1 family hydrophobic/amphiphilic exporter-1
MHEITGAIISITLVMAAVFIPVTFIQGPTGVFYKQFGITLIVAILISAINALTLSPVLCSLFLKPAHHDKEYEEKSTMGKFSIDLMCFQSFYRQIRKSFCVFNSS